MFNTLGVSDDIIQKLEKNGFVSPTSIQEKAIPVILSGLDIVGRSQTGSGKTLAYGIPAIQLVDRDMKKPEVLIVSPTRELATQICDELKKVAEPLNVKVYPVYGGSDFTRQVYGMKKASIIVGTPGRVLDHINKNSLKLKNLKMLVLDEADEMFDMGFRDDIKKIIDFTPETRQTVMFSATMPTEIKNIATTYMNDPVTIEVGQECKAIDQIDQSYIRANKENKITAVLNIFSVDKPKNVIVFCNTKRMVDILNTALNEKGINSLALHGDMRQNERKRVMDKIKDSKDNHNILIATDVAARGIDIKDIDLVINYDIPNNVETYTHRIGRTARAGKEGKAITILNTSAQLGSIREIEKITKANLIDSSLEYGVNYKIKEDKVSTRSNSGKRRTMEGGHTSKFAREKSFSRDRKPFDRDRQDRKKKSIFTKSAFAESEGYDDDIVESKKSVGRDNKYSHDSKKSFGEKKYSKDKKSYGEDNYSTEKKSYSENRYSKDKKSFGDKPYKSERKSYQDKKSFGEKRTSGRENENSSRNYGKKKSFGSKREESYESFIGNRVIYEKDDPTSSYGHKPKNKKENFFSKNKKKR